MILPLVTISVSGEQIVGAVVGAAAFLTATGYLIRKGKKLMRMLHAMHALIQHELTHNHGTSMKDDVHASAVAIGALSRQVDSLDERLDNVETFLTSTLRRGPD